MFDFSPLYDAVYAIIGVPATLSAGTAGEIALTVIDDTRPKTLPAVRPKCAASGLVPLPAFPNSPRTGLRATTTTARC